MSSSRTWRQLVDEATRRLGSASEARRVVERVSGLEGTAYLTGLDGTVPERAMPFFEQLVERRSAGEPLQYVLGRWGFRRLDLFVDRRVLIPRPETEFVVEVALAELAFLGVKRPNVVDLGTGSGAIALSVAVEVPDSLVVGVDCSVDALAVASANLAGLGTMAGRRVRLRLGSWFDGVPDTLRGDVHLVIANPPYVADDEVLPAEVQDWEPSGALRAGPTGMEATGRIVADAPAWLTRPGALVVEVAPHQSSAALASARAAGFSSADVHVDLTGRDRVLVARLA